MTSTEQREAARQFVNRWINKGKEDEHGRSFWIDLLSNVLEMDNVTERIDFEKKVVVNGNTKRIDAYIPETHVIIEQKSLGKVLDQKILNSGDINLTPYEQAKRYNDNLPYTEKARWIITCNFSNIWIYDMDARVPEPLKIELEDLPNKYPLLEFLVKKEIKAISNEMEISIKAGEIVGLLYDAFLEQYKIPDIAEKDETPEQRVKREHKLKSLNTLCVRLVFCLYAEDAGVFGKRNIFHDYISSYSIKDCRKALIELFKILDTPCDKRDDYLEEDLAQFPYVNGGLFADETIEIPPFTEEIKQLLLIKASEKFNWSEISPTIFGAVFESTLNPETRRSGGMHYTSIENIHKVIDPLFLNDLEKEFNEVKNKPISGGARTKGLRNFQEKLANLKFFDPACGSGNFLTESFVSLRRLENAVLRELDNERTEGQLSFSFISEEDLNVKVSIQQFYGIEINDFAVAVSKTALWIAEAQMLSETKAFAEISNDFLPLKTYTNIVEGNALEIDWESIVPKSELNYIMGNPPFIGYSLQTSAQKKDILSVYIDENGKPYKTSGKIDYVAGWYFKASEFMKNTEMKTAFVSTNSITQGEQVSGVWKPLYERFGIHIDFAYRTFRWDSEASLKAHVHCVIIGFSSSASYRTKYLYKENSDMPFLADNINFYLTDAPNIFVETQKKPLCNMPEMIKGSSPVDGGNLLFTNEEYKEFIEQEPLAKKYMKHFWGAREFLHQMPRWCLWLIDITPKELNTLKKVKEQVVKTKDFRLNSKKEATRKYAEYPTRFMELRQPTTQYILVPRHSSENRRYIPFGFMDKDEICSDANNMIPNAELYHFGILESNVHMAWVRAVCGRIKSDYRYSNDIVYNTFPWCAPTKEQKKKIEQTAQAILDARALYAESSLADLYDPLTMPAELRKAHIDNDKAVMSAYNFKMKMSEEDCVAELMKMYQRLITGQN